MDIALHLSVYVEMKMNECIIIDPMGIDNLISLKQLKCKIEIHISIQLCLLICLISNMNYS